MATQPSGTVTLVFTDIEGSTRLLHELGQDAYRDALTEHRRIVREAFARHDGYEVDYEGDAFFYAFASADEAVAAVSEAQVALEGGPIRIRVGIHTGEPGLDPPKYVGVDVHLAARIMSAGHGGQVLLSRATRERVEVELTELGEHRLKDIDSPVPLYQLGSARFAPLKTISNTNLPRPASSFVGRENEVAEVTELICGSRLVTLTGPGGTGKTRLAIEAAAELVGEFKAGVFWVGLADLRDAALVVETIANTIGAKEDLVVAIGERELLLLLDNLEQVIDAAPDLSGLLEACPNLSLLVTSRELLRIDGEAEYPVRPLAEPEAVELFCARSRVEANATVAELCRRLDSLPLAVELAAARTRVLSPGQILDRLGQRLDLLKGGRDADPRQQTLRATIEWSYGLLLDEEKQLFARLAVFAGGCTLDAAEEVAAADIDTLQSLVDKSLLRHTDERFWMLETIREFGLEPLAECSDARALKDRHTLHFLAVAERVETVLRGGDQRVWLERLEHEHDNLRAALSWCREAGEAELGLRLATALWRFWRTHNHLAEGRRALEAFLELGEAAPPSLRARALLGASRLAWDEGDLKSSVTRGEDALVAARTSGAPRAIAAATENLGMTMLFTKAPRRALELLEDSVTRFRALGDHVATADALNNLGNALLEVGETARAADVLAESLALQRDAENAVGTAFVLSTLGYVALHEGDLELARARLEECLALFHELGDISGVGESLEGLAHIAAGRGDDRRAVVLWAAGESIRAEAGARMQPTEAAIHEDALSLVRIRLSESTLAAAWAEGAALAPEDAVAYALP